MRAIMMKLTWHGHSNFEISDSLDTIIDPFFMGNSMADVKWDEVNPDVLVITHGHADHMGDAMSIAKATDCDVISVNEIAKYVQSRGIDALGANIGGTIELGPVKYSLVQAVHSNGIDEAGFGWDAGSPAGVVVQDTSAVYHAGDTALFNDMSLIREIYRPKVALLPIGGRFTMDVQAAVMAAKLLKPEIVVPMHYNTFDVIGADPWKFQKLVEDETDSEAIVMEPGDSIDI
jgi:L-ascorbate metabolism protein UlaG (beta-lactamase superfamily)